VRNNINYVKDPVDFEYVEDPKEVLDTQGADCESGTLLIAAMLKSIGISTELVLIPGHAFLRIYWPDARNKYHILGDDYIYLDWTCSTCEFGEITASSVQAHKTFLEV